MLLRVPFSHQTRYYGEMPFNGKFVLGNKLKIEQHHLNSYFLEISLDSAKVDGATKHQTYRTL
jgi:hypothetical protein